MNLFKVFEVLFAIGVSIFLLFVLIYAHSVTNKCSIEESTRKFKSIIKIIIKTLFEKDSINKLDVRIGTNENGYMVDETIIYEFSNLKKEFKSFRLHRMPDEYPQYMIYKFIAKYPINVIDDNPRGLTKFIKNLVEEVVKQYTLRMGFDIDVNGFVAVEYDIESGYLIIGIARSQEGISQICDFNISIEQRINKKELQSLEKKEMTEEWKVTN